MEGLCTTKKAGVTLLGLTLLQLIGLTSAGIMSFGIGSIKGKMFNCSFTKFATKNPYIFIIR